MLHFFETCVFDTQRRELRRDSVPIAVEPKVFDLLAFLIENRERVVSKDDLLAGVWEGRIVSESTLSSAVNAARTAIGDSGEEQRLIRTLPRKGFRFVGTVRVEQGEEGSPAPTTGSLSSETAVSGAISAGEVVAVAPEHGQLIEAPGDVVPLVARSRLTLSAPLVIVVLLAGAIAGTAGTLTYLYWFAASAPQIIASAQPFDPSKVPLVEDETRRSLASYLTRPDHKALAITGGGNAVSDGQPSSEAAKEDALRRCNVASKRQCRIYAVGTDVVWSKDWLPLAAVEDLRYEPLDAPLVPDEIPTLPRDRREIIARVHMNARNYRALAIATGLHWTMGGRGTRAEAIRLAIERCAENFQRPCLLLAVDGMLTMRIPKSRQVVRIFLPSVESEIHEKERERIGRIYQGAEWRALARGKNGSWHAVAGEASEAAAIEAALRQCAQAETDCRLYAIGNFHVAAE
jgi:DNA-binding winged helix-turn-helix (wHTH) protein